MSRTMLVAFGLIALAAVTPNSAAAQLYKGKTITMIVNYPAGGPTDLEARIVALHLPAHIPGKPTVVVKDVGGAGGQIGSNQLGEAAPNGETIGFFTLDMPRQILADPALKTPYSNFVFVAGVESPLAISRCVWDSIVRAPTACQQTKSERYCGMMGSSASVAVARPRLVISRRSLRAAMRPSSMWKESFM